MASLASSTSTSLVVRASLVPQGAARFTSSPVIGLPNFAQKGGVRCSIDEKKASSATGGVGAASMIAAWATMMSSPAAMALVDERMSTEGTGLPFGLSNNLLGWILFAVFGVIWSVYFSYTATLEEDEESGLSL